MSFRKSVHRASALNLEALERRSLLSAGLYDYVSDLTPTAITNGYGPIGLNQSNGEAAAGDGRAISLNSVACGKGLGVHSDSDITFDISGRYRSFVAEVGVDDEVGSAGSVVFQVYGDGALFYNSGVMTGASRTRKVNLDVTGVDMLRLVVTDAGDGANHDHADWARARLVKPVGVAPSVRLPGDAALDEPNLALRAGGSFVDKVGGPYVGTIDFGDGRGIQPLDLADDKTFSLDHSFVDLKDGVYYVSVRISNGKATGLRRMRVTVHNDTPSEVGLLGAGPGGALSAKAGLPFFGFGVFADPGLVNGEQYTYSADYGDGTPIDSAPIAGRQFFLNHTFASSGTYAIRTTVTDSAGNIGSGMNTIVVTDPSYSYLSDLPREDNATVSLDANARNGGGLKINGIRFAKGLGVTPGAGSLRFNLAGSYEWLVGDVGVDDAAGPDGSVNFQVFADGAKIFESNPMTGMDPAQHVLVNVHGYEKLTLVVTDLGDGSNKDYADWAGMRIV